MISEKIQCIDDEKKEKKDIEITENEKKQNNFIPVQMPSEIPEPVRLYLHYTHMMNDLKEQIKKCKPEFHIFIQEKQQMIERNNQQRQKENRNKQQKEEDQNDDEKKEKEEKVKL